MNCGISAAVPSSLLTLSTFFPDSPILAHGSRDTLSLRSKHPPYYRNRPLRHPGPPLSPASLLSSPDLSLVSSHRRNPTPSTLSYTRTHPPLRQDHVIARVPSDRTLVFPLPRLSTPIQDCPPRRWRRRRCISTLPPPLCPSKKDHPHLPFLWSLSRNSLSTRSRRTLTLPRASDRMERSIIRSRRRRRNGHGSDRDR